ncbi:glycerophosphodiester phosphodiesterase [Roseomonas sp. ACRSG]|nr:glycerophosphodiester phosphodiesterase [Roseomonas sp. ACRSG]
MPNRYQADIVSHRGGTFLWPENSLEAFENSLMLGIEQAECDVHLSADGIPVVIHDPVLQRTTEAQGSVAALSAEALGQIRLRGGRGGTIPTLAEVATLFTGKSMQLQVEVKPYITGAAYPGLLDRSLAVLDKAGIRSQCRIIAFDAEVAAAAQQAGGLAGVIWLFERRLLQAVGAEGVIAVARAYGFNMVETDVVALDAELCDRFRAAGLRLGAWGANHAETLKKAFSLPLDAVATDNPVLATELRG